MPGGLTRVSRARDIARRVDAARRRQQGHLGARRRAGRRLERCSTARRAPSSSRARRRLCPSRVADNLFWLGRYDRARRGRRAPLPLCAAPARRGADPRRRRAASDAVACSSACSPAALDADERQRERARARDAVLRGALRPRARRRRSAARSRRSTGSRGSCATGSRPTPGACSAGSSRSSPRPRRTARSRVGDALELLDRHGRCGSRRSAASRWRA